MSLGSYAVLFPEDPSGSRKPDGCTLVSVSASCSKYPSLNVWGNGCHFPIAYTQFAVLSPREPHHSPKTPPESHPRFLSSPSLFAESTPQPRFGAWASGGEVTGLFTIVEKPHSPTGLWGRCWIRGQGPWDSEISFLLSVHPKGNQSRIFVGRTDAEAEAPILWPADVKN